MLIYENTLFLNEDIDNLINYSENTLNSIVLEGNMEQDQILINKAKNLLVDLKELKNLTKDSEKLFASRRQIINLIQLLITILAAITIATPLGIAAAIYTSTLAASYIVSFLVGYLFGTALAKYWTVRDKKEYKEALRKEHISIQDKLDNKNISDKSKEQLKKLDESVLKMMSKL